MNGLQFKVRSGIVFAAIAAGLLAAGPSREVQGQEPAKKRDTAWSLDEALEQLAFHPKDPYLQYVALQLGKREGRENDVIAWIQARGAAGNAPGRRSRADLFSTFSG